MSRSCLNVCDTLNILFNSLSTDVTQLAWIVWFFTTFLMQLEYTTFQYTKLGGGEGGGRQKVFTVPSHNALFEHQSGEGKGDLCLCIYSSENISNLSLSQSLNFKWVLSFIFQSFSNQRSSINGRPLCVRLCILYPFCYDNCNIGFSIIFVSLCLFHISFWYFVVSVSASSDKRLCWLDCSSHHSALTPLPSPHGLKLTAVL